MARPRLRFVGTELYFDDLTAAKRFYRKVLGLKVSDEEPGRYARFLPWAAFLCLEKKGSESYRSRDKAVVFFEVADLGAAVKAIGRKRFLQIEPRGRGRRPAWAVLHDPEGHNVLLLQARKG
jgi:predicted enzyme related to lactoylglutathione lyase